MTIDPKAIDKLVARRVKLGGARASGKARILLAKLLKAHGGDSLVTALVYWDFATERQAKKFVLEMDASG